MDEKPRATLADVAAAAGVSKMTASRALRGARDVSSANIEKVRQAAKIVGYVGNHLASALSGQRSNLIGVVVPSLTNIVFAEVLAGIAAGIGGSRMQPVFGVTDYNLDTEYDIIRNMLSWSPAGLIVTGLDQADNTKDLLKTADIPIVQIMDTDGTPGDACVGFSHRAAGAAMADALIGLGRRRIGYVGCNLTKDTRARKRLDGFKSTLADRGHTLALEIIHDMPSAIAEGRALTARALTEKPDLDAIFYSNDDLAAGAAFHCLSHGIDAPGSLQLAGFNGLDLVESLPVSILTSKTPRRQIGENAARHIVDASGGRAPSQAPITQYTAPIIVAAKGV